MKKPEWTSTILVCTAATLLLAAKPSVVKKNYISVEKAAKAGSVNLLIHGNGGFSGNCIALSILNTLDDSGYYFVEAGRRLHSSDTGNQDILLAKDLLIPLAPHQERHIFLFGFCCQKHKNAPGLQSFYTVGKMADYKLAALAQYLNHPDTTQGRIDLGNMQQAVWVISDNIPISQLIPHGKDSAAVQKLLVTVEKIKASTPFAKRRHIIRKQKQEEYAQDITTVAPTGKTHGTVCGFNY
jgi:hypothetical protein